MKLKLYAILLILSLLIASSLFLHNANALDDTKVIKGKLTIADSKRYPFFIFGGEEVGSFKMKFVGDRLKVVKVVMDEPPRKGYQYLIGFTDDGTGHRVLKNDVEHPFGITYSYSSDQRTIVLKDIPHIHSIPDFLVVYENDYSRSIYGKEIGFAALQNPANLNIGHTRFEYEDAVVVHTMEVDRHEYKVGETVKIKFKLINIGNETITIAHGEPPFTVNVYSPKGNYAWLFSCAYLDIYRTTVLVPGVPWGLEGPQNCYDIKLSKLGEYVIISYSDLSVYEEGMSHLDSRVYSNPVAIKVVS